MMEQERIGGYRTDVEYTRQFCRDLSPTNLRLVAALNGFRAPRPEGFDYCELGCGMGDTLVALAAANPHARFWGVDLLPGHVAAARRLAEEGGVTNVQLLECDFERLPREALPRFDFVVAHGVCSWISPEKRRAMFDVARALLTPGGIFFVSYNALPGWSAIEPLRRLLLDATRDMEADPIARARRGIEFARALLDGGARYFAENPGARAVLEMIEQKDLAYVVHEYFHDHWHPLYFRDLATELTSHSEDPFTFAGQYPLYANYTELAIPERLRDDFRRVPDRITYESLKDYASGTSFRRDVWIRGPAESSEEIRRAYLDTTPFASRLGPEREVAFPDAKLSFRGPVHDAVLAAIASRARCVRELLEDPTLAELGADRIRGALKKLVIGGLAWPMLRSSPPEAKAEAPPADPEARIRHRVPLAYNRAILAQPLSSAYPYAVASEAAGTGIALTLFEVLSIRLLTETPPALRPAFLRSLLANAKLRVRFEDRMVADVEEQATLFEKDFASFEEKALPKLLELGIVAHSDP
ncbi:MAG: class I SAM-dependent methyltransferase [Polyangiaceae bacterium]